MTLLTLIFILPFCHAAHIIKDKDEAHHVTQHIMGATGKKHTHDEVHEIRGAFKKLVKDHEEEFGEIPAYNERRHSVTDLNKRAKRERKLIEENDLKKKPKAASSEPQQR